MRANPGQPREPVPPWVGPPLATSSDRVLLIRGGPSAIVPRFRREVEVLEASGWGLLSAASPCPREAVVTLSDARARSLLGAY